MTEDTVPVDPAPVVEEATEAVEATEAAEGVEGAEREAEADEPAAKRAKPQDPVTLGPKTFTTGESLFLYFANILRKMTINQNFNEYEHMVTKDLIEKGHSDPASKIGVGIKCFQVREHEQFKSRCLFVVRTDGTMDDFSYRKCCDKLMPMTDEQLKEIGLGPKSNNANAQGHKKHKQGGRGGRGGRGGGGGRGRGRGRRN